MALNMVFHLLLTMLVALATLRLCSTHIYPCSINYGDYITNDCFPLIQAISLLWLYQDEFGKDRTADLP